MQPSLNILFDSIARGEVKKILCFQDHIHVYDYAGSYVKYFISKRDQVFSEIYTLCKKNNVAIEMKNSFNFFGAMYKLTAFVLMVLTIIFVVQFIYLVSETEKKVQGVSFGEKTSEYKIIKHDDKNKEDNVGLFLDENIMYEVDGVVDYFANPTKYEKVKMSHGLLLYGPPGTGKTQIARYIAQQSNANFIQVSASELESKWVGESAQQVKRLFALARSNKPAIIFIDEVDAIARKRSGGAGYHAQILNQLLVELDGFAKNDNILVIAATNRKDTLDPAFLRPGRFDLHIEVSLPNQQVRKQLFDYYLSLYQYVDYDNIDTEALSYMMHNVSPAEIANYCRQAAIISAREQVYINYDILTEAIDKANFGLKKSMDNINMDEYTQTVFHELGHAFMSYYYKKKIYKVSAIPRGMALGWVSYYRDDNKNSMTLKEYNERIQISLAGQVMEELIYGKESVTSGAYSDLESVQRIARAMVRKMGLTKIKLSYVDDHVESQYISESTKAQLDEEINTIVNNNYSEVKKILSSNLKIIKQVKDILMEEKEIYGDEFYSLVDSLIKK